jgi:glycosyltransferase involved in cell wall biosynthesis
MNPPLRLTVVMTHPVQYMSPWFRHIAAHCADLDLTVLYGALPDEEQQGEGFGKAFAWDIPLTDGYRFEVCRGARVTSFDSERFLGLDVTDIEQRLRDTRPDVVVVPGWHSIMQVRALRASRTLGVPVLYRGDSTLLSGPRHVVRPFWRLKTRHMLRRFDGYLSVGIHAEQYLRSFGIPEPLIVRSPHCVDNARFTSEALRLRGGEGRAAQRRAIGATAEDFVVLFAGKVQDRKCPIDAVRAVARVGPSTVLLMAGDGPLVAACQAEAQRLGLRLTWLGFLNQTELPRAFAAADCALVPSTWETWGLIVNEALASGVPCVVTSGVASAPDLIVEGETGHVVAAGDTGAMAARLAEIRDRQRGGHDFAARCRRQIEDYSFAVAADGLSAACRRVVARRGAAFGRPSVVACCGPMVSVYGLERMTFELLGGLREHGAAVHCIVNSWGSSQIVDLAIAAGASWSPGGYLAPAFRWRGRSTREAVQLAWDIGRVSAMLWREARRRRASHVLVPDMASALWNLPALGLLRLLGVSVIARLGNAPDSSGLYNFVWGRLINSVVSQFVANSKFTADALAATGVSERKIRIVRNAPPSRRHTAHSSSLEPKHSDRIVYVGQLIPPKGCDRLLEAIAILVGRGHDVSLVVVGDTERWEPDSWKGFIDGLQARARQSDLEGRVQFLGEREDVPAILAAASLHCFPSRLDTREGFGIVTVEAKTAGIPSVVTPSGAAAEIVEHRQDGWICTDDSIESLVVGLEYFIADREKLIEAGRQAAASAARFSRDRFVAAWLDVFGMASPARLVAAMRTDVVHRHAD